MLIFKGEGWWWQRATTLDNEHTLLIFEEGSGGKDQPLENKHVCSLSQEKGGRGAAKSYQPRNEHTLLVFEEGGGSREQPSRKRAHMLVFAGEGR